MSFDAKDIAVEYHETARNNHLDALSDAALEAEITAFAATYGLDEHQDLLLHGAFVARSKSTFENVASLSEAEKQSLRDEQLHKWRQPMALYRMIIFCSVGAAVNGMDLVSINGANLFMPKQFGIAGGGQDAWILGVVNSAPYFCCALFSVWLNAPLNKWFGRRGVLFITGVFCFAACFASAFCNNWWELVIARAVLGFGIGPKSATLSVYAAESAPARIRGALTMSWQIWVAFGIMLGTAFSLAFYHVPDANGIVGLNWRLMLAVPAIPALVVVAVAYTNPESPRWLMQKGRYRDAFSALRRLRNSDIQAARDLYYTHMLLQQEEEVLTGDLAASRSILQLFKHRRNRNATIGSFIVMFAQQFCGVNIVSYYSTTIFTEAGASVTHALLASWGFGMLNFLFALPAVRTIDVYGRRSLLLWTFPFMALFLCVTAGAFYINDATTKLGVVAAGIYLYVIAYSPGEGPVPFVYSAEAFPLAVRDLGMSWAVFICWFFNSIVGLSFPSLLHSFGPAGTFFWYAAWNAALYVAIYFFLPETKAFTLEELDQVFEVPMQEHAKHHLSEIPNNMRRIFLRQDIPKRSLYNFD
ncbi:MFS transporter, partial [Aureobasidium melanogenum]